MDWREVEFELVQEATHLFWVEVLIERFRFVGAGLSSTTWMQSAFG